MLRGVTCGRWRPEPIGLRWIPLGGSVTPANCRANSSQLTARPAPLVRTGLRWDGSLAQGMRRAVPGAAAGCEADGESPKDRSEAEPAAGRPARGREWEARPGSCPRALGRGTPNGLHRAHYSHCRAFRRQIEPGPHGGLPAHPTAFYEGASPVELSAWATVTIDGVFTLLSANELFHRLGGVDHVQDSDAIVIVHIELARIESLLP